MFPQELKPFPHGKYIVLQGRCPSSWETWALPQKANSLFLKVVVFSTKEFFFLHGELA